MVVPSGFFSSTRWAIACIRCVLPSPVPPHKKSGLYRGPPSPADPHAAAALENNSSAVLMLFEHIWATGLAEALRNAQGEMVLSERIPCVVIDELLAARAAS